MRSTLLVIAVLAVGVLFWAFWLPALLCFAVALLIAVCVDWDHVVAWFNCDPFMNPEAKNRMRELQTEARALQFKADNWDGYMQQERDYEITRSRKAAFTREYRRRMLGL